MYENIYKTLLKLKKNSSIIIFITSIFTIIGATLIYYSIYNRGLLESIIMAFQIFALDTKIPNDFGIETTISSKWYLIYLFSFSGFCTTFFTIIIIFLDKTFLKYNLYRIKQQQFILVCGLGKNNRIYIDSELEKSKYPIIVIENNKNNLYIENYREKEVAIIIDDATDLNLYNGINLNHIKHAVISVGSDMKNLEIATQLTKISNKINLYIHIENRNIRYFHKENGLLQSYNIKLYSYYEDASRELFKKYDIYGNGNEILTTNNEYSIVIIGDTILSYEVLFQACIMGQLPNENILTIYCLDKKPNKFKRMVELNYPEIQNVPNVKIQFIKFDKDSKESYTNDLWFMKNLTNIIICYENEETNLHIAANLYDLTYLKEIELKQLKTNIILAIFNEYNISNCIKTNINSFEKFFTFGLTKDICTKEYLIDEIRDSRAKATNDIYNENASPNNKKSWEERSYFEKESNRTSADHIKIKQKYLEYDNSDSAKEKLARCEHNRWNTFHFLNGWKYSEKTNKNLKLHNCLLPYDKLEESIKDYDREMIYNIKKILNY